MPRGPDAGLPPGRPGRGEHRPRAAPGAVDELALLAALAGQGAVALENSALYLDIRDVRDFLQSIIDLSPDAIITTDGRGRVTYFSRAAAAMFGSRAEER
ncbi:MAG TPA: PAS domain-containing protein [Methylomirabilota bacterium]|nr:PAS domain-containing protein [Methylomirabilota bacterium]